MSKARIEFRPHVIEQLKKRRKLSNQLIAEATGVNKATVGRILNGKQNPDTVETQFWGKLAAFLCVAPGSFLTIGTPWERIEHGQAVGEAAREMASSAQMIVSVCRDFDSFLAPKELYEQVELRRSRRIYDNQSDINTRLERCRVSANLRTNLRLSHNYILKIFTSATKAVNLSNRLDPTCLTEIKRNLDANCDNTAVGFVPDSMWQRVRNLIASPTSDKDWYKINVSTNGIAMLWTLNSTWRTYDPEIVKTLLEACNTRMEAILGVEMPRVGSPSKTFAFANSEAQARLRDAVKRASAR